MMTDNIKENDILVSTLLNPEANVNDLTKSEVNSDNTQFLPIESYRNSDFIKQVFTDKEGKFNEEAFKNAYNVAAQNYSDLLFSDVSKNVKDFIEYNQKDIYAPENAKYKTPEYKISRVSNPYESITGISSLFGTAESNKSVRELAQKNKIYDSETGKYLDKSAEDLGLLGGLFSTPLVYAKYHEDGEHVDPITGRTVKHRKGEYRVNEDGKFFTETIGKRQGYDEEFVALSDILTKEDSWLNKIDVFDSDDKEKSTVGTIVKAVAQIAPYLTPWGTVWGGITAGVKMASTLPTFAKALEGLIVGDKETSFTNSMSLVENYFKRFDRSMSDEGQTKPFGLESIANTVSDVFAQLYQMRAAASLSKLSKVNYQEANAKAFNNFVTNHRQALEGLRRNGNLTKESLGELWKEIASQTPELSEIIQKQSKLSRSLSLGYMALLTSSDVYKEAFDGGYSRRVAGTAALASTISQYYMMSSLDDRISSWFLDSVVGYHLPENRELVKSGLKPLWKTIEDKVAKAESLKGVEAQKEFASIFSKIHNNIKKAYYNVLDGTSEFWSKSLAETVEEVSEEAMMDVTKGAFDALSYFGFLGAKNKEASFNTIENTFSKEGATRYLQNALGGFLGGGLFHLQQKYVEPFLRGEAISKDTQVELIQLIQQGKAEECKQLARELGKRDKNASPILFQNNDGLVEVTSNNGDQTRGDLIANKVVEHIEFLQGLLNQYNANLSQDQLLDKVIKDRAIRKVVKDSEIANLLFEDIDRDLAELAETTEKVNALSQTENPTESQTAELNKLNTKKAELEKKIESYFNGEQEEYYLKAALAYLNPNIRDYISDITLYQFAKVKTGQDWENIQDKESIINEYNQWKNITDRRQQIKLLVDTMDDLEPLFSPAYTKYRERYTDIRDIVLKNILSETNFNLEENLESSNYNLLVKLSTATKSSGLKGATLEDILNIQPEYVFTNITKKLYDDSPELFDALATAGGISQEQFLSSLSNILAQEFSRYPIEEWDQNRINEVLKKFLDQIKDTIGEDLPALSLLIDQYRPNIQFKEELAKEAIKSYTMSQEKLDGELIRRLRKMALSSSTSQAVLNNLNQGLNRELLTEFNDLLIENDPELKRQYEEDPDYFDESQLIESIALSSTKPIKDIISAGIEYGDNMDTIAESVSNTIISKLLNSGDSRITKLLEDRTSPLHQKIRDFVKQFILDRKEFDDLKFLDSIKNKEILNSPLYDLLRNLSVHLSPEVKTSIINLLENESKTMSGLYDITQYIKMPDVIEQIKNAKSVLNIAKAILAGMEESESNPGTLFSYNSQVKKFLNTFKNGQNADKYHTLPTRDIYVINKDLDLLIEKLNFIEKLSGMNTLSQVEADKTTRKKFNSLLIESLKNKASQLQINGVSVAPPENLGILDDDTIPEHVRIGRFSHLLFQKFKEIIDSGMDVNTAIEILLSNLKINVDAIVNSSLETTRLDSELQRITDYDFVVWLSTVLGSDSHEFNYKYKEYLQANLDNNIVPLYIQELNTHIAYSVLSDELGVHNAVQSYIIKNSKGYPADTKNIIFIDGVSGSGKTTAIAKLLLEFKPSPNIIVAAPNNNHVTGRGQANKLKEALGLSLEKEKALNKEQLLRLFVTDEFYARLVSDSSKTTFENESVIQNKQVEDASYPCLSDSIIEDTIFKQGVQSPDIIFIDEVTHFNTAELQILDKAAERFGFKIVTLGDSYQESANIGNTEAHIDSIFSWKGPRLGISSRPANVNKKDNIDKFQVALDTYYNKLRDSHSATQADKELSNYLTSIGLGIKYYEDQSSLQGDKIVSNISVEDLNKIKSILGGDKVLIITSLDESGQIKDATFKALLESSNLEESDYELRSPDKIHAYAVQGEEAKYAIINGIESSSNNIDTIKKLYTLLTRSQEGSIIKLPDSLQNKLRISNISSVKPSIYKLPGLDQNQDIKQGRIEDIKSIIGTYTPPTGRSTPENSTEGVTPSQTAEGAVPEQTAETPKQNRTKERSPKQYIEALLQEPTQNMEQGSEDDSLVQQTTTIGNTTPKDTPESFYINEGTPPELKGSMNFNKDVEDQDLKEGPPVKILCYGFYNHVGVIKNGDKWSSGDRTTPVDLETFNLQFDDEEVLGYIKLRNLISICGNNKGKFDSGLRDTTFTKSIVAFARKINDNLKNYDDTSVLNWLKASIKIKKKDYIVGLKMSDYDIPILKQGFDFSKLVENGSPLLLLAKGVVIEDSKGTYFNGYVTVGSLPKSSTLATAQNSITSKVLYQQVKDLEDQAAIELEKDSYVVFEGLNYYKIGTADGRWVKKAKDSTENSVSLLSLQQRAVNIKEVKLISSTSESIKKFTEWAKKYGVPESMIVKNGKFLLAGRYLVRAAFTACNDSDNGQKSETDHIFIVEPAEISCQEAIKQLKEIQGDLSKKREILGAYSYSNLVLHILQNNGIFDIYNPGLKANLGQIMQTLHTILSKNNNNSNKTRLIEDFINKKSFTADSLKGLFIKDPDIAILLVDQLIKGINNDYIELNPEYKLNSREVPIPTFKLVTNVSPVGIADNKGCMPIEVNTEILSKLILTTGYYEPPLFGLTLQNIQVVGYNGTEEQITTQEDKNEQAQPNEVKTYNMSNVIDFLESYGYNDVSEDEESKIRESIQKVVNSNLDESIKDSILNNLEEYFTIQDGEIRIKLDQDSELVRKLEDIYDNNVIICSI